MCLTSIKPRQRREAISGRRGPHRCRCAGSERRRGACRHGRDPGTWAEYFLRLPKSAGANRASIHARRLVSDRRYRLASMKMGFSTSLGRSSDPDQNRKRRESSNRRCRSRLRQGAGDSRDRCAGEKWKAGGIDRAGARRVRRWSRRGTRRN